MDNFRKLPPRERQRAIDGIINAPLRPRANSSPRPRITRQSLSIDSKKPLSNSFRPQTAIKPAMPVTTPPEPPAPSLLQKNLANKKGFWPFRRKKNRGPLGRRRKLTKWQKIRKWSWRIGLVLLIIFALIGSFLVAKGYIKIHKVFKGGGSAPALQSQVNPSLLKGEGDGRINILLMGKGGPGHDGADLTDTMLFVSIDPVNNTAAMVSIPRDLWVTVPGFGSSKINAIYAFAKEQALSRNPRDKAAAEKAGVDKAESVVSSVLNMPIHYYGMVDFQAFKQAVDTVGGVDINVTSDTAVTEMLWDESSGKNYYLNVQPGQQHFDGMRALYFARSRHTSPRGDFDRTERQRLLITALSQKVLSAGTYSNPAKISGLMSAFGDHVSTDMSVNDAVRLMTIGKNVGSKIESLDLDSAGNVLVKTGMISGQSVVLPAAGLGNYQDIQAYVHSKMKDGYIVKENANITLLNGTGIAGLAASKADQLKYYGYNVGTVGDAPSTIPKTLVVDLTGNQKPYTKNYLEKRFGVKATSSLPSGIQAGNANFVIILGQDAATNR